MAWNDWPCLLRWGFAGFIAGIIIVLLGVFDMGCPEGNCFFMEKVLIWINDFGQSQCSAVFGCSNGICGNCSLLGGPVIVIAELTLLGVLAGFACREIGSWGIGKKKGK